MSQYNGHVRDVNPVYVNVFLFSIFHRINIDLVAITSPSSHQDTNLLKCLNLWFASVTDRDNTLASSEVAHWLCARSWLSGN